MRILSFIVNLVDLHFSGLKNYIIVIILIALKGRLI